MDTVRITRISPLELTMREVSANMEELAAEFAFSTVPGSFELIAIEEPDPSVFMPPRRKAEVLIHPRARQLKSLPAPTRTASSQN